MLLLHAADLHLGKTLHERDISEDQEAMLEGLLGLLADRRPAALLLAGDLYDRSIPPPEAVRLFDSFLSRASSADPGLVIVAIPGNHDSAARLSFGTRLMSRSGVHIRTLPEDCDEPVLVEREGERAAIWPLPFLGSGAFDAKAGVHSPNSGAHNPNSGAHNPNSGQPRGQAELFSEALRRIGEKLADPDRPERGARNVLLAHCFAAGGTASESERAFVGQSEQVDAGPFEAFDYVALGHLHRFQKVGERARYAGSPLAYSFAEGEEPKGFVLVDLKNEGGFEAELLPFVPLRRMRRVEGPFSVLSAPGSYSEYRDDFVEARLTDPEPVLNPADPLRAVFPNLLAVRQAAFELAEPSPGAASLPLDGPRALAEDFAAFHVEMKGEAPDEATAELFASLVREAEHATL
jgi:DNA repair protein SbcD/Mre11